MKLRVGCCKQRLFTINRGKKVYIIYDYDASPDDFIFCYNYNTIIRISVEVVGLGRSLSLAHYHLNSQIHLSLRKRTELLVFKFQKPFHKGMLLNCLDQNTSIFHTSGTGRISICQPRQLQNKAKPLESLICLQKVKLPTVSNQSQGISDYYCSNCIRDGRLDRQQSKLASCFADYPTQLLVWVLYLPLQRDGLMESKGPFRNLPKGISFACPIILYYLYNITWTLLGQFWN